MAVVAGLTIAAYVQKSNLWPILLIFASPVAAAFVALVWYVSWMKYGAAA